MAASWSMVSRPISSAKAISMGTSRGAAQDFVDFTPAGYGGGHGNCVWFDVPQHQEVYGRIAEGKQIVHGASIV